jgi:hypothetical protein
MDDKRMIEEAFKWAEAHSQSGRAVVPITPDEQREGFAHNTGLAIAAYRQILSLELDESDPLYKAKLQAKATAASQQLIAALRADENKLKAAVVERDFYNELRNALAEYRAKRDATHRGACSEAD